MQLRTAESIDPKDMVSFAYLFRDLDGDRIFRASIVNLVVLDFHRVHRLPHVRGGSFRAIAMPDDADTILIRADEATHDDRYDGILDIDPERLLDIAGKFGGCFSGCRQIFDQGHGNLAVGAHRYGG